MKKKALPKLLKQNQVFFQKKNPTIFDIQTHLIKFGNPLTKMEYVSVKEEYQLDDSKCRSDSVQSKEEIVTSGACAESTSEHCAVSDNVTKNPVRNILAEHLYQLSRVNEDKDYMVPCRYSIEQFKDDPRGVFYFTGLLNHEQFMMIFRTLGKKVHHIKYNYEDPKREMTPENQFFLTLWKLRRNCCDYELSRHFCVSEVNARLIFKKMITFMASQWKLLDIWPTQEFLKPYMPAGCEPSIDDPKVVKVVSEDSRSRILRNIRACTEKNIHAYKMLGKSLMPAYVALVSEITSVCVILCSFKEILKK